MNSKLVSACALTGIALTVFGAGSATAEEANTGSIGFFADNLAPGERVDIFGTCDDPNFTTTPVVSEVLDMPDLYGAEDGIGGRTLKSFGTVAADATGGTWPVHFMCGTTKVKTTFTVKAPVAPVEPVRDVANDTVVTTSTKAPVATTTTRPPAKPTDTADTAALDPAADDSATGVLALGGLAVLAAAGGALVLRRRRA